jgi:hypothetical protein
MEVLGDLWRIQEGEGDYLGYTLNFYMGAFLYHGFARATSMMSLLAVLNSHF